MRVSALSITSSSPPARAARLMKVPATGFSVVTSEPTSRIRPAFSMSPSEWVIGVERWGEVICEVPITERKSFCAK